MNKDIKKVLEKIESSGFEAYVIGGYVRDYLLGINSTDIDICTNALPKDLVNIFNNLNASSNEYGAFKIVSKNYNFDITTYRKDLKYNGRYPEVEYVNNLIEDIERRDFTINTICMNSKEEIIDLLNAKEDINNRIIKCIGNCDKKLKEDPLRILRALRFAIILDFNIDDTLLKSIIKNKALIKTLSNNRIKQELDTILISKHCLKGLEMLKNLGILDILEVSYNNITYVDDLCGIYSQLNISDKFLFTKSEKNIINNLKKIISYGRIDNNILFEYGLYTSTVAGKVLKADIVKINKMYNDLPLKSMSNIDITTKEICDILHITPSNIIKEIRNTLKDNILNNGLLNDKEELIKFIINNKGMWI